MRAGKQKTIDGREEKKIIENNKMHSGTHRMSLWPETESENNVWHTIESSAHYLFCVALFKWCLIKWFVAGAWPVDRFSWLVWLVCCVRVTDDLSKLVRNGRFIGWNDAWTWRRCQLELLPFYIFPRLNTSAIHLLVFQVARGWCILCAHQTQ